MNSNLPDIETGEIYNSDYMSDDEYSPFSNSNHSYSPKLSSPSVNSDIEIRYIKKNNNRIYSYDLTPPKPEIYLCYICSNEIKDFCMLSCGHILCLQCFVRWFNENKTCPYCRTELDVEYVNNSELVRRYRNERRELSRYVSSIERLNRNLIAQNEEYQSEAENNNGSNIASKCLIGTISVGFIYAIIFHLIKV